MAVSKRHNFELLMQGKSVHVLLTQVRVGLYKVWLGDEDIQLGELRSNPSGRGFACTDLRSGRLFIGHTREQAATKLLYTCYPKGAT